MKIGLVCPYNMFRGGGVQEVVLATARELERRGHHVRIISPRPKGFDGPVPDDYYLLGASRDVRTFSTTPSFSISVDMEAIDAMFENEQFDVLHFHEPWVPVLSRQILGRSPCVNVATVHAKLPDSIAIKTLTGVVTPYVKSVIRLVDQFTAVSDAAAEYLHSVSKSLDVTIVPNGIDLKRYIHPKKAQDRQQHQTILFIGRLEKRKGVLHLLKAFAEVVKHQPRTRLLIAGDGAERERLEQKVDELGLTAEVEFLGYIDEEQKRTLLSACTLFCSPALYGESFGIVLLEAMAMGAPIVAGDNPGYASVMKGEGAISLVNPKDTEAFAALLERFLTDQQLRESWSAWAKSYVQQFDYPHIVDQYEALYKEALDAAS